MDIFSVLSMIGGLAMFLYGMETMGDGLAKTAGGKLEQILEKLTSTPIKGVLLGAAVTAVIQSSSATTVMVVGFVNSGIMKLSQAVGIIMGANVGTTVTSWIVSLAGIESNNILLQFLKPTSFCPILALIGIIFIMFTKDEKKHDIGGILLGFAVLMFGMDTMSNAVKPLADVPEFTGILTMFSNPLLGMLAGAILTAVIQSSSASVGILQALCATGSVTFGTALPIIMGQNIGTCITALISAIGAKKNAKRAAFVHLYFNIIGTVLFMIVFYTLNAFLHFAFLGQATNAAGVAVIHSVFNVIATVCLLPFHRLLEKLATITVRGNDEDEEEMEGLPTELALLDERFLEKPAFAVGHCVTVARKMAEVTEESLVLATNLLDHYDKKTAKRVAVLESQIDTFEDMLGTYIIKLSSKPLSIADNQTITTILHCSGNFERISDHAMNICETAQEMHKKELVFSEKASAELQTYIQALRKIVSMTMQAFNTDDYDLAKHVEPLEDVIDGINSKAKKHHIKRLQKGKCTIALSVPFEDLLTNFERVSDHCSNVAVCMIQTKDDVYDTHEYLDTLKENNTPEFRAMYEEYKEKYGL
ncbi:MAG: Na/Pi cotransporter family protein [Lachnospiraceae bacterium]|nr:Na/Pi cotransporter family protein [Lachnospiraceae bacterium]